MDGEKTVKVWDPLVREFHWALVGAFVVAYAVEEDFLWLHTAAGYTVLGLVVLRILWGFVGTCYARFSSFVVPPRALGQYLKQALLLRPTRYLGHNPAGGAMVVLLLAALLLTTVSGLAVYGAGDLAGPLAGWLGDTSDPVVDVLQELHKFFANLTAALVLVHIGGVLLTSLIHRENLVRAMLHGYKRVLRTREVAR